ncbi:S41 family peptidase [Tenacibaculum sp. nBUS_03]|uniref:S41 family peptidase n=1 Tax=Tenacibaculum sp. nBUS_03 TaxID=3395320 RepID=UPI003EC047FB
MNFFKIPVFLFILFTIISCSEKEPTPENIEVQDFIWKGLNAYYLWQDQISDLSDRRFSSDQQLYKYLSGFNDNQNLFNSLLKTNDDRSILIDDYTTLETPIRNTVTNGVEFGIIAKTSITKNVIGYVTHILPNSDAATKSISRGDFFYAVNNTQLTRDNYLSLLNENTLTLEMADFDGTNVIPNSKKVTLVKQQYDFPAVFLEKVITNGTDKIGYLAYNNDFSSNYLKDLNTTFSNFKSQSVNELIIDLRYNIGGGSFAKNITKIASMITGQFKDEVFIKEQWNTKAQSWFEVNQPDSLNTTFTDKLNKNSAINSLNLTDLYIILNGEEFTGSPATELLINSLKPYINVHIVGRQTSGNNTGSIILYNSEDYDFENRNIKHTFALKPIVLKFLNKDKETYDNGFAPNIELCPNEDVLNLGVLGENTDPILNRVINYISNGSSSPIPLCNPNNFDFLYNSINPQRNWNQNVTITQNLPNTN